MHVEQLVECKLEGETVCGENQPHYDIVHHISELVV
jgi:hypothetical protein